MTRWRAIRLGVAATVVVALSLLAWWASPDPDSPIQPGPWYSILPPLLAVTMAMVTGRVMESLLASILIGGLLVTVPVAPTSIAAWGGGVLTGASFIYASATDWTNIKLLAFVVLVLSMVATVIIGGGLHGIVLWLSRFAKGPRSVQFVTALMGVAVFIDDYANTMIVGASMRPVTDRFRVSREKLAFLVDATSAPIAGLAVISTWVGYEVGLFSEAADSLGIDSSGYAMLFDALVFRFYCVMMLFFVFVNIFFGKDFGGMAKAERRTRDSGAVAEPDATPMTSKTFASASPHEHANIRAITGVIPIGALFVFLLLAIWGDGGGWAVLRESPGALLHFRTWREVISASENSITLLAYAGAFALFLAVLCARFIGRIAWPVVGRAVLGGARSSLLPVLILLLAWSLKGACDALSTGPFLVAAVGDAVPAMFFPAITFCIAILTSFATGTSYGTMAILMPTAVPIAYHLEGGTYGLITMITLAAILDGSIVGDHCSPISDTTIMSSISSSCDHVHHVRTQLPYSLFVAVVALCCGYIPAGAGWPSWMGFLAAFVIIILLYVVLPRHLTAEQMAKAVPEAGDGHS